MKQFEYDIEKECIDKRRTVGQNSKFMIKNI